MSEPQVIGSVGETTPEPSVVTVGFFDGVHRGHQAIVARAVDAARARGVRAVAVTFDRHPREVLAPGSQPRYLMTLDRRVRTLLPLGPDLVLVQPFTLDFSRWTPERFAEELLGGGLGAVGVVVGGNFRFGRDQAGDVEVLGVLGERCGFETVAVDLVDVDGATISSTAIRQHLAEGQVEWAALALGRPHVLDGLVVRGEGRGRSIGIPTANIEVGARMQVPGRGVYAGHVTHGQERFPAAVNVGVRPTFGGERLVIEAHLVDEELDLYGARVSVGFGHRLRDERRFPTPDELVAQIHDDIEQVRGLLGG